MTEGVTVWEEETYYEARRRRFFSYTSRASDDEPPVPMASKRKLVQGRWAQPIEEE